MTYRARPKWLRRIRMAFDVLVGETSLLDRPEALLSPTSAMRQVYVPGRSGVIPTPTPIADDLARFAELKRGIAALVETERATEVTTGLLPRYERVLLSLDEMNAAAGYKPEVPEAEFAPMGAGSR